LKTKTEALGVIHFREAVWKNGVAGDRGILFVIYYFKIKSTCSAVVTDLKTPPSPLSPPQ
jgi:hypothetical protein